MKGPGGATEFQLGVGTAMFQTEYLPSRVTDVPREVVRAFSHTKRVGTYLLGRTLGEGSFAKVKEALHLPTGVKVAVKVIDKKRAKSDPYVRKNLRREGRLLQQVRHPHVVQLLEVLETEHSYYLVMERCAGGDLMEHIATHKRLQEREVKKFIRQIVSAVDYLHRLGIIHRDLKIENLLLDHSSDIKIIDFGLSNSIKVSSSPDGTPRAQEYLVTQCGSPAYAAPELLNHRKYGLEVDVWSIGVNMYAMLTGSLPFTVNPFNIKTLYNKMISGQMNPIPDTLSREGRDILKKFLTADPEKRLTIAQAFCHPWLSEGCNKPLQRHPFPNKLKASDLDVDVLKHMSDNLGHRMSEVIRFVVGNVPSGACATYHLYVQKLQRHRAEQQGGSRGTDGTDKHAQHAKISLDLQGQGMAPRTIPYNCAKNKASQKDSVDGNTYSPADIHVLSRKSDKQRPSLLAVSKSGDESTVIREKTFLSSQGYSTEDIEIVAKESRSHLLNRSKARSTSLSQPSQPQSRNFSSMVPRVISPAMVALRILPQQRPGISVQQNADAPPRQKTTPLSTARGVSAAAMGSSLTTHQAASQPAADRPKSKPRVTAGEAGGGVGGGRIPPTSLRSVAERMRFLAARSAGFPDTHDPRGAIEGARMLRATYPATAVTPDLTAAGRNLSHNVGGSHHALRPAGSRQRWGTRMTAAVVATMAHAASGDVLDKYKEEFSKRPASPPVIQLVRRRLAKRSRQDGLVHVMNELTHRAPGSGHPRTSAIPDDNVTVEWLAATPNLRTSTVTSSRPCSPARDMHKGLPTIATTVSPRH